MMKNITKFTAKYLALEKEFHKKFQELIVKEKEDHFPKIKDAHTDFVKFWEKFLNGMQTKSNAHHLLITSVTEDVLSPLQEKYKILKATKERLHKSYGGMQQKTKQTLEKLSNAKSEAMKQFQKLSEHHARLQDEKAHLVVCSGENNLKKMTQVHAKIHKTETTIKAQLGKAEKSFALYEKVLQTANEEKMHDFDVTSPQLLEHYEDSE